MQGGEAMGWCRIKLTQDEQRAVNEERESHPDVGVRRKLLTIWLLHCGTTRESAAKIVGVARSTVERYVATYRHEGLDGLRQPNGHYKPVSELAAHREAIRRAFEDRPVCTIAEASQRIFELTGIRRGPSQVRKFLKDLGLKWQRIRAIPVPPKKTWPNMWLIKPPFTTAN
jgi:transposase